MAFLAHAHRYSKPGLVRGGAVSAGSSVGKRGKASRNGLFLGVRLVAQKCIDLHHRLRGQLAQHLRGKKSEESSGLELEDTSSRPQRSMAETRVTRKGLVVGDPIGPRETDWNLWGCNPATHSPQSHSCELELRIPQRKALWWVTPLVLERLTD